MKNHYSFKIKHSNLDLDDISKKIPMKVRRIWRVGDDRTTPQGQALEGKNKESYCIFEFPKEMETLSEAILFIQEIFSKNFQLNKEDDLSQLRKSIYCTIDGVGEEIDLKSIEILHRLGIVLEID